LNFMTMKSKSLYTNVSEIRRQVAYKYLARIQVKRNATSGNDKGRYRCAIEIGEYKIQI
jgi:hypothetical protein